jgi:hypothetical protein
MIIKILRLSGILVLSCGIFACGKPSTTLPTGQNTATSSQKQSLEVSSQVNPSPIAASSSKSEPASANYSTDVIYAELSRDRETKIITDEARWNELELVARDQIMKISEQFDLLDSQASKQQSPDNSDRQEIQAVFNVFVNPRATRNLPRATIQRLAIVDNTALLTYQRDGMGGGMMLLRKEEGRWLVLTQGGGTISLMTLSEYNVPRTTGQALLNQLNMER